MKPPKLRELLILLANEWELYADQDVSFGARRAYKDAAAGLRRALSAPRSVPRRSRQTDPRERDQSRGSCESQPQSRSRP